MTIVFSDTILSLHFIVVYFLSYAIAHFFFFKVISEQAYRKWSTMRQEAMSAIENKEKLLMDTTAYMENNLTLLGIY